MESLLESIFVDVDGRRCRHYPEAGEAFSLLMSSRMVFESHLLFDRVRDANRGRLNQCRRGLLQETLTEELRGSPVTLRLGGFIRGLPMCSSTSAKGPPQELPLALQPISASPLRVVVGSAAVALASSVSGHQNHLGESHELRPSSCR